MSDNLKMCRHMAHKSCYRCARCARTFCMACDWHKDCDEVKTIVRYCQDWRCQREKAIEEGVVMTINATRRTMPDAIVRRFVEGENIEQLADDCGPKDDYASLMYVEQCLRRAIEWKI